MNFRQIEAFRTVITAGSVTGAAQLLSVSQPAVSRLLADLERNIGFPLFQKQGRNLVATEEGRAMYEAVDRAFVGLEDIKSAADAIRHYQTGTLNLVTMPGLASRLLPELIQSFCTDNPSIGVWLEVLPRIEALKAIKSGQYDVGIISGPVNDDRLTKKALCNLQAYCVLPVGHRLTKKTSIQPEDLDGERFISLSRDSLFHFTVTTLLDQHGVKCRTDMQARTADAIYGMVAAGLGVSIVGPDLPEELKGRKILFKPLKPQLRIEIDLVMSDDHPVSRLGRLFSAAAIKQAKNFNTAVQKE
jgi:DNA-binding transcriptional LysR family regulator